MDLSIVIPYVHSYPEIIQTLFAFQNELIDENYTYEIIVVENRDVDLYTERFLHYFRVPRSREFIRYFFEEVPCYSDDTEVLTDNGWKLFKNIIYKDKIATLNPKTEEIEYYFPSKIIKKYYKGNMFYQRTRSINILVTPNHSLWIGAVWKRKNLDNWFFIKAKDCPKRVRYKRNGIWKGKEVDWFTLPEHYIEWWSGKHYSMKRVTYYPELRISMDGWLSFFGIWLADGYASHTEGNGYVVAIRQNMNSYTFDVIEEMIKKLPFRFRKYKDRLVCNNKQLYIYLNKFGKSEDKYIPKEILELSSRQLTILFKWMMLGDGHKEKWRRYSTISNRLAGNFQELLLKIGYAGTVSERREGGFTNSLINRIDISRKMLTPEINRYNDNRSWVDYDGMVYCVEVPNHIVYVRRHGRACWCGNCGPAARMKGAVEARGKYLMFADAHTQPGKDTLPLLVDLLEENVEVGSVHGSTMYSHVDLKRGAGCHYDLFGGDINLYSHFHGRYQRCQCLEPYRVAGASLAYMMVRREEFLGLRGYHSECRGYPHPEGYVPLKYQMFGLECWSVPSAWHLHSLYPRNYGSRPDVYIMIEGEKYLLIGNDNLVRNAMICAGTLGGEEWVDKVYNEWRGRGGHKRVLDGIRVSALEAMGEERGWIVNNAEFTLDEVLDDLYKKNVRGMEKWK